VDREKTGRGSGELRLAIDPPCWIGFQSTPNETFELLVPCPLCRKGWMRFKIGFSALVCRLPAEPDFPVLEHQREEFRLNRREKVRVTILIRAVIEFSLVYVGHSAEFGDSEAWPIIVLIDSEDSVDAHDA